MFLCFRNGAARTQTIDFGRAESELPENLIVVFSNLWGALRGHFGDAMHLKPAADRRRQLAAPSAAWIETLGDYTPSASNEVVTCAPSPVRSRRYKAVTIVE